MPSLARKVYPKTGQLFETTLDDGDRRHGVPVTAKLLDDALVQIGTNDVRHVDSRIAYDSVTLIAISPGRLTLAAKIKRAELACADALLRDVRRALARQAGLGGGVVYS